MRGTLLNGDGAPVTKMTTWSNALATNYPITPNLLSPSTAHVTYVDDNERQRTASSRPICRPLLAL